MHACLQANYIYYICQLWVSPYSDQGFENAFLNLWPWAASSKSEVNPNLATDNNIIVDLFHARVTMHALSRPWSEMGNSKSGLR